MTPVSPPSPDDPRGMADPVRPDPPRVLSGDDGETVFVRADLGASLAEARAAALAEGHSTDGTEVDLVEMLPVPEHFIDIDYEWGVVRDGTPDAARYWRFRL